VVSPVAPSHTPTLRVERPGHAQRAGKRKSPSPARTATAGAGTLATAPTVKVTSKALLPNEPGTASHVAFGVAGLATILLLARLGWAAVRDRRFDMP
jgi:hypothetical protein